MEYRERLIVNSRIDLGIGYTELRGLTVRHIHLLWQRHQQARRERGHTLEFMLAQLTAMVGNTGFRGWKEPRSLTEFLPVYADAGREKRQRLPSQKKLSSSLERAMERAMRYQAAQVERGVEE